MDLDLIERSLNGETEAFSELVEKYQRVIYFTALRMLSEQEDAADVTQQTFINAFRSLAKFRKESSFKTWLYQIAINLCRNRIRERTQQPDFEEIEEMDIAATERTPFEKLDDEYTSDQVNRAIQALPEQQRSTVILRIYGECSYEQIAHILECAQETARANYHHGVRNLRKALKEVMI